ncbi:hypothetical protein AB0C28_01140 [Nonomuraea sp. NPDC048892]|uniref:hypothetical protein n=1 Tax=Nonomuraea sp. NPDC048892 TaxID=3154624 RepID=UPI0033CA081B
MEFRSDVFGVGAAEFVEDGQGVLPRLSRGLVTAQGGVRVAEVHQRFGLCRAIPPDAEEFEGLVVTRGTNQRGVGPN